jgi:hypothetical protein
MGTADRQTLQEGKMKWKRRKQKQNEVPSGAGCPATIEQAAAIKRLQEKIVWQTSFRDWLKTRFGLKRIDSHDQAAQIIDALNSKLRNQKSPAMISDPKGPATPEQLAGIERLSKTIRWDTGFGEWLWKKCGFEQVELYGQAERTIAELKDKLKAQLFDHDAARSDDRRDRLRRKCATRR